MREETWRIGDLTPHPQNYNAHPAEQVERIAASLRAFGQPKRIVVRSDGTILAGHGVWQGAMAAGWDKVNVAIVPDDWSDDRALAYLVADNETRRGAEPDDEALAELVELARQEVDLSALGFDDAGLQALLDMLSCDAIGIDEAFDKVPEGDRLPFQQMTFTVSDAQAECIREALAAAKDAGDFVDTDNENSNGNALARVAEAYLGNG